jgi:hypothetical protein
LYNLQLATCNPQPCNPATLQPCNFATLQLCPLPPLWQNCCCFDKRTTVPNGAISIGPDGVKVEPIVDPTKIAIAFFTAAAAILMSMRRIRRFGK